MAIEQPTKDKIRPVMDYRELNQHVDTFITNADVCTTKLTGVTSEGELCSTARFEESL